MVTTHRCTECGDLWIEKADLLDDVARTGYEKVDGERGRCRNCGAVQAV